MSGHWLFMQTRQKKRGFHTTRRVGKADSGGVGLRPIATRVSSDPSVGGSELRERLRCMKES